MSDDKAIHFTFNRHGLGDCVHAAFAVQLYRNRGYEVFVRTEENKRFVWDVAGVCQVNEPLRDHPYHYPHGFEDLSQPDFLTNKVSGFFKQAGLPRLPGDEESIWRELCDVRLSAAPFIRDEVREGAARFIEGLPRPIFALHSSGTNWRERKSIPPGTAFDVIRLLLTSGGSVISLDWDSRDPIVGSERCRPIWPNWGKIDPEHLCALYEQIDLMIGIDSGPFHLAAMTPVRSLGVFRSLYPVRCCLPHPNAVYLCPRHLESQWASRRPLWNIVTYRDAEPTADDICYAASQRLSASGEVIATSDVPGDADLDALMAALCGRYLYRRVGHDERILQFELDGAITEGGGGCEQQWFPRIVNGAVVIDICGKEGVICSCEQSGEVFRGAWLKFERMPIELIPQRIAPCNSPS